MTLETVFMKADITNCVSLPGYFEILGYSLARICRQTGDWPF